ncbi:MAG: response regulator [Euryarchaeota archaeon]|nr:response regulator [Euryarchaeota archaeon]
MPRIMVVDDEPDIRMVLLRMLKKRGYEVELCESAEEAIERLRGGSLPDLIIMDLMMPGMSGTEACRAIKSDARLRGIPLIILTVMSEPEAKEESRDAGADAHVDKPINMAKLFATIEALLQK